MGMRLSVDPKDEGYPAFKELHENGKDVVVYLNGYLFERAVITADDEEGYIKFKCVDDDGYYLLDPDDPRYCLTDHRYGEVEIELVPAEPKPKNKNLH